MPDFDRAVADHRAGRIADAAEVYRRILDDDPGHADAWHLLGLSLHQRGENVLAVQTIRRAIELNPKVANYHNGLGLSLHALGKTSEAEQALQTAVTLDPNDADAFSNLGMVLTDLRRFDEARAALQRSLEIRPGNQGAIYNLGRVLAWLGDYSAAASKLREACACDPRNPTYWNMLGVALMQLHDPAGARSAYETAISIDPNRVDPHVNLAHSLLLACEFEAGWAEHEWRLRRPEFRQRLRIDPWRGEDIDERTILLWAEQGLGDAIQFVRYAPLVAARGARVVVECPAALHSLFRTIEGVADVVAPGAMPPHDAHAALLSLPAVFGVASDPEPYLRAPVGMALEADGKRRVGLVWAGNPAHSNDRNRSFHLADFAPLAVPDAAFFSLQVGSAAVQPAADSMALTRLGGGFRDFADTAAALASLDLLITVDTAVAHLAGAMGVPTWLLLPSCPDWRWGWEGDTTVWYPGMRLFRQRPGEARQAVIARAAKALVG